MSLVRRAAPLVLTLPQAKRARLAYSVARTAMAYGPKAYRAARTIGRAWRRGRRRAIYRKRRGKSYRARTAPSAKTMARQKMSLSNGFTVPRRTMLITPLVFQRSDLENIIGARDGIHAVFKGVKICEQFNCINFTNQNPIEVHWALVQLKAPLGANETLQSYITKDFFRDTRSDTRRTSDFVDATVSSPYEFGYSCFPINPTRLNVISHKRRVLNPPSGQAYSVHSWKWKIEKYIKIGKRLVFTDMGDTLGKLPFCTLIWWQETTTNDWPIDPTANPNLNRAYNHITYYK